MLLLPWLQGSLEFQHLFFFVNLLWRIGVSICLLASYVQRQNIFLCLSRLSPNKYLNTTMQATREGLQWNRASRVKSFRGHIFSSWNSMVHGTLICTNFKQIGERTRTTFIAAPHVANGPEIPPYDLIAANLLFLQSCRVTRLSHTWKHSCKQSHET